MKTLLIGIDEAGYGPNLGPLCVAATAWEVSLAPAARTNDPPKDLYSRLSKIVTHTPDGTRLAIGDSKVLYKSGAGLRELERGVLAALGVVGDGAGVGDDAARWSDFLRVTKADDLQLRCALPWYADCDCALPIDATRAELGELSERFAAGCQAAGVRLVAMRARLVFPAEFNRLTNQYDSKGATLSHISIELLKDVLENLPTAHRSLPTTVTFDKHGGRNRYAHLLQHHFPDQPIETLLESRPMSRYAWGSADRRIEVCFRTGGEAELPTALASMTAKYHRELAMRAFNQFWCQQIPGLRPTAGYPVDAKRFKLEYAAKQKRLGLQNCDLWRDR